MVRSSVILKRWNRQSAHIILPALLLTGCAAIKRPATTPHNLKQESVALAELQRKTIATVLDELSLRAAQRDDGKLDLLFLSGGGQQGAYGAGFLRGWLDRTESPIPQFDLVTGVSTGALQAPFAFLGTPHALATVAALYRDAAKEFALAIDWWFWLRQTGGVVDASQFRATIERAFDSAMMVELARGFAAHRQLLVATTDLDLGVGRMWSVGQEAIRNAPAARMHELLIASSAIPSIFPSVVLDGHVHSDGGVVANLLSPLEYQDFQALADRLEKQSIRKPVTVRVWVIMNLWMETQPVVVNPAKRGQVNERATAVMFYSHQPQLIERLANLARAVNGQIKNLRMQLRFTSVPRELATAPGAQDLLSESLMKQLEETGYNRARGPHPWDEMISPYQRNDAVVDTE